jgi:pyruvate kinase
VNRVKIVGTIGPSTAAPERLAALRAAGMDVARLNGAHADHAWHAGMIEVIRATIPDVPILLDIPGRKIRTGRLAAPIPVAEGDLVVITTEPGHDGSPKIPVTYAGLHADVAAHDAILMDDGNLRLTVLAVEGRDIICRTLNAGLLQSGKGLHAPGVRLRLGFVSERDRNLLTFAREHGVDFVGMSFVDSGEHVQAVRTLVGKDGPRIVAKVETRSALEQLAEIIAAADALMIDRGDLSVETSLERVALFQKRVLSEARRAGRPIIVATEMLHSMIEQRFPTKAEVSDITNAVLDGADALMLSGETAMGKFPIEAVAAMRTIADVIVEDHQQRLDGAAADASSSVPEAIGEAIALICRRVAVSKIVAVTRSGYAARMIAARMPRQPILAVSDDPVAARAFNLVRGVRGFYVDIPFSRTGVEHVPRCLETLWRAGELTDDDLVLVTAVSYPRSGNRMNLIETHRVADLRETLAWFR